MKMTCKIVAISKACNTLTSVQNSCVRWFGSDRKLLLSGTSTQNLIPVLMVDNMSDQIQYEAQILPTMMDG